MSFELYWSLIIVISVITGCVSISASASLVRIPIGITSSVIGFKICVITAGIKKYKTIIEKKKKKKHDKIVLLTKSKLNSMEALISKNLTDSNVNHDEFVLINNLLKEFYDMKKEIKTSNNKQKFKLYIKQCYLIAWSVEIIQKVKIQKL